MNLHWTISSIPELRELPPGHRRAVYYRCSQRLLRQWQSWVGHATIILVAFFAAHLFTALLQRSTSPQVSILLAALRIPVMIAIFLPLSRLLDHHLIRPHLRDELGTTHCPRCGYDIRASPERCPECGDPLPPDRGPRIKPSTSNDPPDAEPNPQDPICNAIERGDPIELRQLIADRPDLAGPVTSDDALLHIAWQINRPLIPELLDLGVNPNQRDTLGGTVLMYAAAEDDADLVALLLARGADANARNDDGETAFSYACTNDSFRAAKRLHAAGASPLDWSVGHASADFHHWLLSIGCRPHADRPAPAAPANPPRSS